MEECQRKLGKIFMTGDDGYRMNDKGRRVVESRKVKGN